MLPKAKGLQIDFEALGEQMLARKQQLKRDGIPDDAEHAMVAAVHGKDDTPAAASRRQKSNSKPVPQSSTARKKAGSASKRRTRHGSRSL